MNATPIHSIKPGTHSSHKLLAGMAGLFRSVLAVGALVFSLFASDVAEGHSLSSWQPSPNGAVFAMAESNADGQHSLLVGGSFTEIGGETRHRLARFTLGTGDPSLDPDFTPAVNGDVRCVVIEADGRILIGGTFTEIEHGPAGNRTVTARNRMARLHPDGSLDTTFNPGFTGSLRAIVVTPEGDIFAAGAFTSPRVRVARLDPVTGALHTSPFDPRPGAEVYALALDADGKLILAGEFTSLQPGGGSNPTFARGRVARIDQTGAVDSFNPNASSWVSNIVVEPDGHILLGGAFIALQPPNAPEAITRKRIARVTNAGGVVTDPLAPRYFNAGDAINNSNVATIALAANGHLFVGGNFTTGGGSAANRLLELNSSGGVVWSENADATVQSLLLEMHPEGDTARLFAGGLFAQFGGPIGGQTRPRLAVFTGLAGFDSLQAVDGTPGHLLWERGGYAPAFAYTTLEIWQNGVWPEPPVQGQREGSDWRFTDIPDGAVTRVTGRPAGGFHSASGGLDQRLRIFRNSPGGTPYAWGHNGNGQLGDGTTTPKSTPTPVVNDLLGDAVAFAGGHDHSLALKSDGTVWAWGLNLNGQLGDGTIVRKTSPIQVSSLSDVVAVAAGSNHSLALKSDGTVWAWGLNISGQLGDGSTFSNRLTPVQVTTLGGVVTIAAGSSHSLAVKSDGTVWAWGWNASGQLGDGSTANRLAPVQVADLGGAVAVSGGAHYSLALTSGGTVWAWGNNDFGQLGDGTTAPSTTPVQVVGMTDAVAVTAGGYHGLALTSSGTIRAWGWNTGGQLGDGTTIQKTTPVQVSNLSGAVALSAGSFHSLAVESDGTVWAWGGNSAGELGDGTTLGKTTPVQVGDLTHVHALTIAAGHGQSLASVIEINEPPTDIALDNSTVAENQDAETVVRNFTATDPDADDTHTFTLVNGAGDDDNESFTIVGNALLTAEVFNYESKTTYTIRVRATDSGELSHEKEFPIQVLTTRHVVTSLADSGIGTLRAAITEANEAGAPHQISFAPALFEGSSELRIIALQTALPDIQQSARIIGPGAHLLTIQPEHGETFRIFRVTNTGELDLSGLTLANGSTPEDGGAIHIDNGNLTISDCIFHGNKGARGGAIFIETRPIVVGNNLLLYENTISISRSTFVGNQANTLGGAINHGSIGRASTLMMENCTFSGNSVQSPTGQGGAVYNLSGTAFIFFFGNASLQTFHCTFFQNSASAGGAIFTRRDSGSANTILAHSVFDGANSLGVSGGGSFISEGYNLSSDAAGGDSGTGPGGRINHPTDRRNTPALLGSIRTHGGGLPTHLPLPGSPLINGGNPNLGPAPATDQRGFDRIEGVAPDIGAVEVLYAVSPAAGTPQTAAPETVFSEPLIALVTERGFPVAGVQVVFTAPAEGASATFDPGTATAMVETDGAGLAVAPALTANGEGGNYLVTAAIVGPFQSAEFSLGNLQSRYAAWIAFHELTGADADPLSNPEKDGVNNLLKFAFNLDPTKPDVRLINSDMLATGPLAGLPLPTRVNGRLRLYYLLPVEPSGITVTPVFHDDLAADPQAWTEQEVTEHVRTFEADGYQLRYADDPAADPGPRRFGRIQVLIDAP